jgi:hypothetical protein
VDESPVGTFRTHAAGPMMSVYGRRADLANADGDYRKCATLFYLGKILAQNLQVVLDVNRRVESAQIDASHQPKGDQTVAGTRRPHGEHGMPRRTNKTQAHFFKRLPGKDHRLVRWGRLKL